MPHYRSMFDNQYLGAWDLAGQDRTLTIAKVVGVDVVGSGGTKNKKPVLTFAEAKSGKGFVCNKTNAKVIAQLYGPDTADWIGKRVTLYPSTTQVGGETVDCIRVRPFSPGAAEEAAQ